MPANAVSTSSMAVVGGAVGHRNLYGQSNLIPAGLSVTDAMSVAGLDYTVEKVPVFTDTGVQMDKFYAVIRTDQPEKPFGIVTGRYALAQNIDSFQVVDYMVQQGCTVEAAGDIDGGRKAWMMLQLPDQVRVAGDVIHPKVLVWNTHDGSGSLAMANTPVRLACTNMLPFVIRGEDGSGLVHKIRHTGDITVKMQEAAAAMGMTADYLAQFAQIGDTLAQKKLGDRALKRLLEKLYPGGTTDSTREKAETKRQAVITTMQTSENLGDHRDNAWGFVNAVGEIADWGSNRERDRIARLTYNSPDTVIKNRALALVMN